MHIQSIIHRLGCRPYRPELLRLSYTQAFDLGLYVTPLQGFSRTQNYTLNNILCRAAEEENEVNKPCKGVT